MEAIGLLVLAVALVALGCLATVVSGKFIPLRIRVRGQNHGRFAGLGASEPVTRGGTGRKVAAPGQVSAQRA